MRALVLVGFLLVAGSATALLPREVFESVGIFRSHGQWIQGWSHANECSGDMYASGIVNGDRANIVFSDSSCMSATWPGIWPLRGNFWRDAGWYYSETYGEDFFEVRFSDPTSDGVRTFSAYERTTAYELGTGMTLVWEGWAEGILLDHTEDTHLACTATVDGDASASCQFRTVTIETP